MEKDSALHSAFMDPYRTPEGKQRKQYRVIAKLIGARCEMEDVLLSSNASTVLSAQERVRLSTLVGAIDKIVRQIEER
jgi:hypothetical protein